MMQSLLHFRWIAEKGAWIESWKSRQASSEWSCRFTTSSHGGIGPLTPVASTSATIIVIMLFLIYANRNTQLQMLWRSRAFAKFLGCMTWLAKMNLIPRFTLSKGSNGLVLNLASWESLRCVGIFVVLIIWILFVGSESCKLGNTAWWCRGQQP